MDIIQYCGVQLGKGLLKLAVSLGGDGKGEAKEMAIGLYNGSTAVAAGAIAMTIFGSLSLPAGAALCAISFLSHAIVNESLNRICGEDSRELESCGEDSRELESCGEDSRELESVARKTAALFSRITSVKLTAFGMDSIDLGFYPFFLYTK